MNKFLDKNKKEIEIGDYVLQRSFMNIISKVKSYTVEPNITLTIEPLNIDVWKSHTLLTSAGISNLEIVTEKEAIMYLLGSGFYSDTCKR